MSKQLEPTERSQIVILLEQGLSVRKVAKKFQVSPSTISRTSKKYAKKKSFEHSKGYGRPKKLTNNVVDIICKEVKKNPKTSLRKIKNTLQENQKISVSHNTVKNALNSRNLFAFAALKKPLLTKKLKLARYQISETWIKMNIEVAKTIIFSDESKFNLIYSDGKVCVWREPKTGLKDKHLKGTVKHGGGNIMVWGCFSYYGIGRLVFIEDTMNGAKYCDILANNLFASAAKMGLDNFIFQQDNDPKHKSKLATSFFQENNIAVLPWPSQSPDMNPIETLWAIIKEKLAGKFSKNKNELKSKILEAWNAIDIKTLEKLSFGFKKRAITLYQAKGGHTKY